MRLSQEFAVVIIHRSRILIQKRSHSRLLQDMWEFPSGQLNRDVPRDFLVNRLQFELGLRIGTPNLLINFKHSITNRVIDLQVYKACLKSPREFHWSRQEKKWIFLFSN